MPHTRTWAMAAVLGAAWMASAGPGAVAAEAPGAKPAPAADRVCLVVVDGPFGLPVATASGFVLGQGKFVVTDLASLAQAGVRQVTVQFKDGTKGVAREFGMADPALGVAAVRVELPPEKTAGLPLSGEAVTEAGLRASVIGWKWGEQLETTAGQLKTGLPAKALAAQAACEAPASDLQFLTFLCPRLDVTSGAAVVDGTGAVVGLVLHVIGAEQPVVVPAADIRQALLSAGTQLKPLSDLPNPRWPVAVQVIPGRPATASAFAAAVRLVKRRSLCPTCKGTGTVIVTRLIGTRVVLGVTRNVYRQENAPCDACQGEAIDCGDGLYEQFSVMAEGATWLISALGTPENVRETAVTNGMGLLEALGKVGPRYRQDFLQQAMADLARPDPQYPRGFITYAQVLETVTLQGARYTVLSAGGSGPLMLVCSEMLSGTYGPEGQPDAPAPREGEWIVAGGIMDGPAAVQGAQPIFVRLFGWAPGPSLGPGAARRTRLASDAAPAPGPGPAVATAPTETAAPAASPPAERPAPASRPRPKKKAGEPSFFGL